MIRFLLLLSFLGCGTSDDTDSSPGPACGCAPVSEDLLEVVLADRFPGWRVVTIDDLRPDDQAIWRRTEGPCPGLIAGRFDASGSEACAVLLMREMNGSLQEQVTVVSSHVDRPEAVVALAPVEASFPGGLALAAPGEYRDVEGEEAAITTSHDAIVLSHPEQGALLVFWTENGYRTLLISE